MEGLVDRYEYAKDGDLIPDFNASPNTVIVLDGSHLAADERKTVKVLGVRLKQMLSGVIPHQNYMAVVKSLSNFHITCAKKYKDYSIFHENQLFKILNIAVKLGSAKAALWVGEFHRHAWFPVSKRDYTMAGNYFKKAANGGDHRGYVGMALCILKLHSKESSISEKAHAYVQKAIQDRVLNRRNVIDLTDGFA